MCISQTNVFQLLSSGLFAKMHTPAVRSLSPISEQDSTHKEYGDDFTTICTQCNKVLLPSLTKGPGISIRASREEDGQWVLPEDIPASYTVKRRHSHGLCRSCFNNMNEDLISSAPPFTNPRTSILSKSLSSTEFCQHLLPSKPKRILIVDDNRLQRQIHKRMAEQAGYECDAVQDGAQALELIQKHSYYLVMMDLIMSPMDGWTAAKKIRTSLLLTLGFPSSLPKIVAVTGMQIDEQLSKQCKDAGMDEVVQKPINTELLNKVLHKHSVVSAMKADR